MTTTFRVEHFEGPLDLLLQLVEQQELDISTISLAQVAEQFVEYVNGSKAIAPEELADFLVVAAKLMYLKSKLLIPSLHDAELEEGPDLEKQLREYRRFVAASRQIDDLWKSDRRSFTRTARAQAPSVGFVFPVGLTPDVMLQIMQRVIARLEPLLRLPEATLERVVSIQEKIRDLFTRIRHQVNTTFRTLLVGAQNKTEAIVSFLALLELVKQRFVSVEQTDLFQDIAIKHDPQSTQAEPVAESYL